MAQDVTLKISGIKEARNVLGAIAGEACVKEALKRAAEILRDRVVDFTPQYVPQKGEKTKHDPGTTKKGWTAPQRVKPTLFVFENPHPWSVTLEEGSYPERMVVGTRADGTPGRLTKEGGKIYSKMAIGGMVGMALKDITVIDRAVKEMIQAYYDVIKRFM